MALYHLDPRQAGSGAAPDVETRIVHGMWTALDRTGDVLARTWGHEAAALRAARKAAGFGHVALEPCHRWFCVAAASELQLCTRCAWPRDAHKEGSK